MDARVRLGWRAGETALSIGADIGRTRSAVLGRVRRMGLPLRRAGRITSETSRAANAQAAAPKSERAALGPISARRAGADAGLSKRGCQFPHGDPKHENFHFCAAAITKPGRPYCDTHMRVAYKIIGGAA
jgi:GcrA cell cycle regulator